MQPQNNLGYDQIIDTAVDVIDVAKAVQEAFADGIDITDAVTLFRVAPRIGEIYNDRNLFVAQLKDLTPEEGIMAAVDISARTNVPGDLVFEKVNEALMLLARTYAEISDDIELAQDWIEWGKSLSPNVDEPQN